MLKRLRLVVRVLALLEQQLTILHKHFKRAVPALARAVQLSKKQLSLHFPLFLSLLGLLLADNVHDRFEDRAVFPQRCRFGPVVCLIHDFLPDPTLPEQASMRFFRLIQALLV